MVHLFTNRFCAHSPKMPINHVESAMTCFTAAVHNPQLQRNKWGISAFWGLYICHLEVVQKTERRLEGERKSDSIYPWVERCGPAPHILTLFKTKIADFPTLYFKTEFRFLTPCLRHLTPNHTLCKTIINIETLSYLIHWQ